MKTHESASFRSVFAVAAAFGLFVGGPTSSSAQQTVTTTTTVTETVPAPLSFDYQLGRVVQERDGNRKVYELRATQPRSSKLTGQAIRLTIEEMTGPDRFTRVVSLRTGKYKSLAQFCETLRDILRKFEREPAANNQVLGKVGDLKYGGEVRFFAESPDVLRYETLTQGEPDRVAKWSRDEVFNVIAVLGGSTTATTTTTTVTTVRKTTE